jgi:AcrR family transcriptional regulator
MKRRAAQTAETRERIRRLASRLFLENWYDQVSLQMVAEEAGVALSTVVRHFPTKVDLLLATIFEGHEDPSCGDERPGEIEHEIGRMVESYELQGMGLIRSLALEQRVPELKPVLEEARRQHRAWIARVLGPHLPRARAKREAMLDDLMLALDVHAWHLMRQVQGRSVKQTKEQFARMVRAVLGR